jgi:large subunit ribosomal protein L10
LAISRERKENLVAEYKDQLSNSQGMVLAHYTALTVAQMQDLRRQAREKQGQVFVVKNTLLDLALQEMDTDPPEGLLVGPTLVAFCHEDVPPLAALFRDFSKDLEEADNFVIRGALLEGNFISSEEALAIADLPTREELMAQVLRTINAPATQIAGVVASGIRQVMNVVQAYVDKLEGGDTPAEAAA